MSSATHKHALRLPLSLLDLTFAQAQARQRLHLLPKSPKPARLGLGLRHASSLAVKSRPPPPEVREGYLAPSLVERDGLGRRRPAANLGKGVRRPWTRRHAEGNGNVNAPTAAALLLHDRVESLLKHTGGGGGELYTPDTQETDVALTNSDSDPESELQYSEPQLRDFYADLLAHPESELEAQARFFPTKTKNKQRDKEELEAAQRKERKEMLESVQSRLIVESDSVSSTETETSPSSSPSLASRLVARRKVSSPLELEESATKGDFLHEMKDQLDPDKLHHNILRRVIDVIRGVEEARNIVGGSSLAEPAGATLAAPVILLSSNEWDALIHACIDENEMDVAENSLLLMKRCGSEPVEELVNDVLNAHASQGDVPAVMTFFEKHAIGKPTERQRDLHIKAHLNSPPSSTSTYGIPSALEVLHKYESLALLPPVQSYTRLICALFSAHSAQLQAQAWDLFAHMRYVAHAKPDPALYALMIRACAGTGFSQHGSAADPVRALDLWTEMTTEAGYAPTVGTYNAVILACARSREYVGEAFRFAKEMLDGHRDAYGYPLMHATQETFDALLVAAKTRKDLPRARWILAEMLKIYEQTAKKAMESDKEVESDVELSGRTLMHVFHAYASYKPPFRRGDTTIVDESVAEVTPKESTDANTSSGEVPSQKEIETSSPLRARFTVTPPQTRQDVLAEADTLFERIIEETGLHPSSPRGTSTTEGPDATTQGPFSRVLLTAPLINSYLSVHYAHDSIENARKLYEGVFQRTGVERSPRTYVEVLERCARAEKEERAFARTFAEGVWKEWEEVERGLNPRSTDARMIERAYAAMIRMFSLVGDLDAALSLTRTFTTLYTPQSISNEPHLQAKPYMRSTRTSLYATGRPLVRLTTPTEVPDDSVPPLLTPRDLELLHHRLVSAGERRRKDLNWLTYLGHAYLGALRKRRDMVIRA